MGISFFTLFFLKNTLHLFLLSFQFYWFMSNKKHVSEKVQVKRPVKDGPPVKPESWDGRFKSVEPMKNQKPSRTRKERYKWNHHATINWIMGQADPVGFLAQVMQGKEMFPVYSQSSDGIVTDMGKICADPELRVLAAKTLLGKCVPDLKAVEVKAQVEEKKIIDISRISDNDLGTIERIIEQSVVESGESRENEEVSEGVHQKLLGDN